MRRFPFLDWMRGLAVAVMIQCHTFNSMTRPDLRNEGPYIYSQFVGGMAAPLFLFMAGMTFAFQMDSLDRRESSAWRRYLAAMKRAGYVLFIAFAFRFSNWLASMPRPQMAEITRVDILNSMALAMAFFATAAVFQWSGRVRFAVAGGFLIAAAAPLIAGLNWDGVPEVVRDYLAPTAKYGRFPFFPTAAYVGFGLAAGAIVKRSAEGMDRMMQWAALGGIALIVTAHYFSNLPYSIYGGLSNFWLNSPELILIRVGISLTLLACAYVWTEYAAGAGWSWMQTLGKNSLMVYWVHIMLVYGNLAKHLKRTMSIPGAALTTLLVTALMVVLSEAWMRWKAKRKGRGTPPGNAKLEAYGTATGALATRTD